MWTLTNLLALFAFMLFGFSQWETEKRKNIKRALAFCVALAVLIVTLIKGCNDKAAEKLSLQRQNSLSASVATISKYQKSIQDKMVTIDTLNNFIKRVEDLGIKRDAGTNTPVITKTINSNIKSQTNVNSINQKGGQTGAIINNK